MQLSLVLSLGDERLSRDAYVFEDQWSRADRGHWRKRKQSSP